MTMPVMRVWRETESFPESGGPVTGIDDNHFIHPPGRFEEFID